MSWSTFERLITKQVGERFRDRINFDFEFQSLPEGKGLAFVYVSTISLNKKANTSLLVLCFCRNNEKFWSVM